MFLMLYMFIYKKSIINIHNYEDTYEFNLNLKYLNEFTDIIIHQIEMNQLNFLISNDFSNNVN